MLGKDRRASTRTTEGEREFEVVESARERVREIERESRLPSKAMAALYAVLSTSAL